METLSDKVRNKVSLFYTLEEFLNDKDEKMVRFISRKLPGDYESLLNLSLEQNRQDITQEIQKLKIYVDLLTDYVNKNSTKNLDEIAISCKKLPEVIKKIMSLI